MGAAELPSYAELLQSKDGDIKGPPVYLLK